MTATLIEENGSSKIASLTPETKEILHQSILHYLHRNGFSKTLKRFQSEAQIQNDTWKTCSTNLEDIYCKFITASSHTEDNVVVESEAKTKKKKKNKQNLATDSETKPDEPKKLVDDDTVNELELEGKKKSKNKKKKSNEQVECIKENVDDVKEEKKSSKKRKRLLSDENDNLSVEIETNLTVKKDEVEKPEMNGEENFESQKSLKKQRVNSTEPKTVNAFQRVKIDEVEFAHEKLQDNSYWAKNGADVGYGAKAQEVLGQVRGRDFRHEKTKKKRGSYRGGQIDLQSHSIKFDYSDEE